MTLLRSILVAVALATLAACASLPARPAGGMVADLTEDVPLVSQDGLEQRLRDGGPADRRAAARVEGDRGALLRPAPERRGLAGHPRQVPAARGRREDRRAVLPRAEVDGARAERLAHAHRHAARERGSPPLRGAGDRRRPQRDRRPARDRRRRQRLAGRARRPEARRCRAGDRLASVRREVPRGRPPPAADRRGHHVARGTAGAGRRGDALRAVARGAPCPAARARRAAARAARDDQPRPRSRPSRSCCNPSRWCARRR